MIMKVTAVKAMMTMMMMMMHLQLFLTSLVLATSIRIVKGQKREGIEPERKREEGVEHQTEEEVEEVEEEIYFTNQAYYQPALEHLQETTGKQYILQYLNRIIQTLLEMRLLQQIIEIFLEPCHLLIFQILVIKERRKKNIVITVKW